MQYKSLALASLATAVVSAQSPPTLAEVLQSKTELSSLTQLFGRYPEAAAALANATGITVLAPSNDAFATAFGGSEIKIPDNETALVGAVLSYHVLQETVASSDFSTTPAFVPTFLDAPFTNITDGQVVEGVKNGSDVVIVSGLKSASKVTTADIEFTGGIIHIIDKVLTIPTRISITAVAAGLTTLAELLVQTGLVKAVDETPDLTVFAPNNAAFQAAAATLGKLDATGVASVLKEHVVPGAVGYSTTLKDGDTFKTLSGGTITITIKDGDIFANGVKIVLADVLVANGVVHVLEEVLRPPFANQTGGKPVNGGTTKPTGTGTGTGPSGATGSPIVPYDASAASSLQAGWMGSIAMIIAAGIYLYA